MLILQVYIVYLGALPALVNYGPLAHHTSVLQKVTGKSSVEHRFVTNYKRSFTGFSAWLTESERDQVERMDGVVSVFPNRIHQLQTTSSWNFLGLKEDERAHSNSTTESNIIIGVIDTGIWPESESFSEKGFSPPPKKWRGACEGGKNFSCNSKLIGARYYGMESARDNDGHGSHTASTAAGNAVKHVSFYGLGNGTARGGVPAARVAVYSVCDIQGCRADRILSAFDDVIADNVDLISISISPFTILRFELDPIAIGAFHAMAKGILTVNSAGNSGPARGTVRSVVPWILTVAASNTNRAFVTKVVLGDGKTVVGKAVNSFELNGTMYPLVYGGSASSRCDAATAGFCTPHCLDTKRVKGKIVLCNSAQNSDEVQSKGAVASIVKSSKVDYALIFSFPVSVLSEEDYNSVLSYMNLTKNPKATVLKSETIFNQTAPITASYSSRGPNTLIPDILKPDITAPGTEILAAYSPIAPPSESDTRRVNYSIISGTSMSCPHIAGVAAYLKTFHPRWSPSMIQSSIMTTAQPMNTSTSPADHMAEFAYGAGHVSPIAAVHPGLVYELTISDHVTFLCGLNYTGKSLRLISGENSSCSEEQSQSLPRNLNYPSMTAKVAATEPFNLTFRRTVTNVGTAKSNYKAKVFGGSKLTIKVVPDSLSLKSMYQKRSFTVTVSGQGPEADKLESAQLIWSDGAHSVKSPIVIYATN
ncbi:PREDICTED: subtilisin-like protease SBT4.5 isoform X1 [Camelina sativa]|uniref:Subtilisin-like protease SBT4.5 isoform X1 n=1 Tax=Camelina sativa TaxID=90675 RepID=A0ABM1QET4_CAMSA|nr:PREDICTED: subtilisin-like protease SBT4.5 isoform X1 [Camelina sativa]